MRLPRIRFTVRRMMLAVASCALILWLIPIGAEYAWTWNVLRDVKRGESTRYSAQGFARIGPRAVQALRVALRSDQIKTRLAAVRSLGVIGRDEEAAVRDLATAAVPELAAALHDQVRNVRMFAAASLGEIGPGAAGAIGPLVELLQHEEDPQMVAQIIQTIGRIGSGAKPAVPVLVSIVKSPQHHAQIMAAQALCRIGPEGRAEATVVIPTVIALLETGSSPRERAWAAKVLAEMGTAAKQAIPALSTSTKNDLDPAVRNAAEKALKAIASTVPNTEPGDGKLLQKH